jgi:hypothetical protein
VGLPQSFAGFTACLHSFTNMKAVPLKARLFLPEKINDEN